MDIGDELLHVQEIISQADVELKSIEVHKDIPLEFDTGLLLATDINEIQNECFQAEDLKKNYLNELARDCIQGLLNNIWDLPHETFDNKNYVTLPKPVVRIPREKKVPKPKPLTKWEQYAKEKGITKTKQSNKVWDDILKKWLPRFGSRKVQADREKNWVMEVPDHADPYEDQFAKSDEKKKEAVAKNEYKRLRNLAKQKNIKVPSVGTLSTVEANKDEIKSAAHQARVATASLGKFQPALRDEKPLAEKRGKKRKVVSQGPSDKLPVDFNSEKKRSMEIVDKIHRPELDYEKAVHKQIRQENIESSHKGKKKELRRSKMGQKKRGVSEHKARAKGKGFSLKTKKSRMFAAATKGGPKSAIAPGTVTGHQGRGQNKNHIKSKVDKGRKRR